MIETPAIKEYISVFVAFSKDNDPGKYSRLSELWDEMSKEEHVFLEENYSNGGF